MLRSFTDHFNSTVFRGPDNEGTGGGNDDGPNSDIGTDGGDNGSADSGVDDSGSEAGAAPPESDKPLTVREQLKKSIAEVNGDQPTAKKRETKAPRTARGQEAAPEPADAPEPAVAAPEALSKEAKAVWDKAPPEIQQAFLKREKDMAAGVEQLKQRYTLIDQAIEPHTDALRQMNATPGEAVNRMFLWFKALASRPGDAFPALAQSIGVDWNTLMQPPAAGAEQQPGVAGGAAPEIPAPVKDYVTQLETQIKNLGQQLQQVSGRFGSVEQTLNTQNEARTRENLSLWSNGKPYFEEVRMDMARLIETGIIPLKQDGQVDLDTAYERAIYFNPEVRAKVLAEQQQANQKVQEQNKTAATTAQTAQVTKARKASVSLPASTTPSGTPGPMAKRKPGEKLSVRDSLKAALAELRDQ